MKKWEKYIFWSVTTLVLALFGWGLWVTNCIYGADKSQGVSQEVVRSIQKDTVEMKKEVETIKSDVKEQTKTMEDRHREVLKLLLEINKNVK
jgi:hypothetical protein